jgi:hypothetical protein
MRKFQRIISVHMFVSFMLAHSIQVYAQAGNPIIKRQAGTTASDGLFVDALGATSRSCTSARKAILI